MFLKLIISVTMQRNYFGDWWNISNRRDQKRMIGVKNVYVCLIITSPNFADLTSIVSFGSTRLRGLRIRFTSVVNPLYKFIFGTFSPSQCSAPSFQIKGIPGGEGNQDAASGSNGDLAIEHTWSHIAGGRFHKTWSKNGYRKGPGEFRN